MMGSPTGFNPHKYDGHTVPTPSAVDLALIGAAVLNSVCTTFHIGHASPGMTLDYLHSLDTLGDDESAAPTIVRDFVAWTSGREDVVPGARDRLEQFIVASGWYREQVGRMGELMSDVPVEAVTS